MIVVRAESARERLIPKKGVAFLRHARAAKPQYPRKLDDAPTHGASIKHDNGYFFGRKSWRILRDCPDMVAVYTVTPFRI